MRLFDTVWKLVMFRVGFKIDIFTNKHFISGTHSHTKIHTLAHTNTHTHNVLWYMGFKFVHTEIVYLNTDVTKKKYILGMDY